MMATHKYSPGPRMRALLTLPIALLMVGSSEAQTPTRILKGAKAFEFIVDTDRASQACGIAKTSIQEQVVRIARSVGLHLTPAEVRPSTNLALSLTIRTKHGMLTGNPNEPHQWNGDICATGIRL